jgi:hypothetical protein
MADNTFTYLDSYCERAGDPHIFAEPLNAFTNLAFIVAAYVAYRFWKKIPGATIKNSWDMLLLMLTLVSIGFGSGAWHLFANSHTLLLDVIPIVIFMNIYLASAGIRLLGLPWYGAVVLLGIFHALNLLSEMYLPRDVLNGSIMYIPAFTMLLIIYGTLTIRKMPSRQLVLKATLIFCASLTFRTVDISICPSFPLGTHFLWHLLNAWMLYLLLKALLIDLTLKKR